MNHKRILTIAVAVFGLALATAFGIFRTAPRTQAQDQLPPPVNDRISFGMIGLASGQTMRVNVSDVVTANDSNWPPGPTRVAIIVVNSRGQALRNRNGVVIRKTVDLERGDSTFLDVDFGELPPPVGDRLQLRAVVVTQPPPVGDTNQQPPPVNDRIVSTVEIVNNANGRTQLTLFTSPAVIRGFNPQPDPPLGE
jgi:hypothetical protein